MKLKKPIKKPIKKLNKHTKINMLTIDLLAAYGECTLYTICNNYIKC